MQNKVKKNRKKTLILFFLFNILISILVLNNDIKNSYAEEINQKIIIDNKEEEKISFKQILGNNIEKWQENLKVFKDNIKDINLFIRNVKESENNLISKKDTEFFEKLNSKIDTKSKHKDNPLLQIKPKKSESKYITNLNLTNNEYSKTISFIPKLRQFYSEEETASFLPYIALCFKNDIKISEINYYVNDFVNKEILIDIAQQRIYNIIINENYF